MRLLVVLFNSLNRLALSPYGGKIETPAFERLARHSIRFDRHYVSSLPGMPARRDMHTGRSSFFHRSWGPMEPFDVSFVDGLKKKGIYTHLITDHFHYFQDGGSGYHSRYHSWEFMRGQEYDPWKAVVEPPLREWRKRYSAKHYDPARKPHHLHHLLNTESMRQEQNLPGPQCFAAALEFLEINRTADNWMLQLELFDPHEPFLAPAHYRRDGDSDYQGPVLNWPDHQPVRESAGEIAEIRANYAALVRMCDAYLGRLLDVFDAHDLWADTALVLASDHGFLLGEHGWWGKSRMPYFEEMVHMPLFFWHPGLVDRAGSQNTALTQAPDIMPTILDLFECPVPEQVRGQSLRSVLSAPQEDRIVAFGLFAGPIGVTDGRHVLFHYPLDLRSDGLFEYTLMPQHMAGPFTANELIDAELHPGFAFTRGMPVLKIPARRDAARAPNFGGGYADTGFALYDLVADPHQQKPIRDAKIESRLYEGLRAVMQAHEAPQELFAWQGLAPATN